MESFSINATLNDTSQKILIIPDECTDQSIFHLVKNGSEYCKLRYTDSKRWELIEDAEIKPEEILELGKKIEEHYF